MEQVKITIGDKKYVVSVAQTDKEKEQGLMGVETLPENQGMLFDYSKQPQTEISFWMKDTLIPLDIVFINDQSIVAAVTQGEPMSEEQIVCEVDEDELISYVVEVNINSGIKEGDKFEISLEDTKEGESVEDTEEEISDEEIEMFLLGPDGQPVHKIEAGCRIFSRPHTKTLIKLSKKAYRSKSENDYKKLGKKLFEMLYVQDTQDAEYVDAPEKKQGE